jgi:hypothetical protein
VDEQVWALGSGVSYVAIGLGMWWFGWRFEKRQWNAGRCPECGGEWRYFDTDSQGGLGFKCDCGRTCWISYRSVMRATE